MESAHTGIFRNLTVTCANVAFTLTVSQGEVLRVQN